MAASGAGERWVGLAMDFSEGSRVALRWAADNLLRTGDQLLLLHVIKEPDYEQSEAILWEATGSREYSTLLSPCLVRARCSCS
jgi:nucleotide-binding universal stress UspA family protein